MTQKTQDWHRADITAAIKKSGTTLRALSLGAGYAHNACCFAMLRPNPKVQAIIAKQIRVKPQVIWPSRYDAVTGTPLSYSEIIRRTAADASQNRRAA